MTSDKQGDDGVSRIRALDEDTINRIAAGEVVQRPAAALKELIENCLDAGATKIDVVLKNGGLKILQITDDGCGIHKGDYPILCKRFTTSKMKKLEDLQSIETFGFRGEALASISMCSRLTITSKRPNEQCAWKATFCDGVMSTGPTPVAGMQGTQINAQDLFYNMPLRRQAMGTGGKEYISCLEVIQLYSVHNPTCGFSCKKSGAGQTDVITRKNSDHKSNIRMIFGPSVARELLPLDVESKPYGCKISGLVSNANFSIKRTNFILFINNRLVDCLHIKRAVDRTYENILPRGAHPFAYINLKIKPINIDVNVHPTKREVHFLHEDAIIVLLQQTIEAALGDASSSRKFYTQTVINPGIGMSVSSLASGGSESKNRLVLAPTKNAKISLGIRVNDTARSREVSVTDRTRMGHKKRKAPAVAAHKMIRTDSTQRSLMSMGVKRRKLNPVKTEPGTAKRVSSGGPVKIKKRVATQRGAFVSDCNLRSIQNLRENIKKCVHHDLAKIMRATTFVGCVDDRRVLFQHGTGLYLADAQRLSRVLGYEMALNRFGAFQKIRLSKPVSIKDLIVLALGSPDSGWTEADGDKFQIAEYIVKLLNDKASMLGDYFGVEIDDGKLHAIPIVLPGYQPPLGYLPKFLLRLGTDVQWNKEELCFHDLAMELSRLYQLRPKYMLQSEENPRNITEHVLFPLMRYFTPPQFLGADGSVIQIASLEKLYKIFERC